jgi:hypothetical protein
LGKVHAVEPVAETTEFQDVILAGGIIRVGMSVFGRH